MKKKTFRLATLGCRTNQYETQAYRDQLEAMGYREAQGGEEAEICIVNTCTVTESADQSSRHQIRKLSRQNPKSRLIVTGCLAERRPDAIKSIEGVEQVISNHEKEHLINSIFPDEQAPEFSIRQFEAHTRAFVKVQDGCNSFCTYCIIPYVRGRSRSRKIEEIIREVEQLVSSGYQEIVITGINVGDFEDRGKNLADLIRLLDQVDGVKRLRLSSIDPDEVDDALLDVIVNGKHTCHSMHIVLQSGSNVMLKRMNRKYTRHIFLETIDKLKQASSKFTFTTDVIVGFPGETEADFQETLSVMREVKFAKVHMFPYSPRERTRAALYPNRVTSEVMLRRKSEVLHVAEEIAFYLRDEYEGSTLEILTESRDGEQVCGHTDNFLQVILKSQVIQPNQFIQVKLIENTPEGLIGVPVS